MTWAKHHAALVWCRIASVETGGSVHTRCAGRWSAEDEYREDESPSMRERCRGCMAAIVRAPAISFAWDMSDVEGG